MTELPLQLLGVRTPNGKAVHLYDLEGDRLKTLCDRWICVNPTYLGLGGDSRQVSADLASCRICIKLAASIE